MVKNIVFDIGNVLVNFRWRELMDDIGLAEDLQPVFEKSVFGSPWWGELDRGVIEEDVVVEKMRGENQDHLEEFNLVWENREKLVEAFDFAVPWIKDLKQRGFCVYLLSNYPRDIFALHAGCGRFPFLDLVDGKVVSGFVRMVKPDADIYRHLLKEYNLKAQECVFIDDREDNIGTARALGMEGIVFRSYGQAAAELDRLL